MGSHVAQAGLKLDPVTEDNLELSILLPLPPVCYDYKHAPSYPVYAALGSKRMHSRQALYQPSHTPQASLTDKHSKQNEGQSVLAEASPISTCTLHGRKRRHRKLGAVSKDT